MTLKEKAQAIRQELRKRGIAPHQVSVRIDRPCAIQCRIKDLSISKELVEKIALSYERIEHCQITGEILGGGNDFVFVVYDLDVIWKARQAYIPLASQIYMHKADKNPVSIVNTPRYNVYYNPGQQPAVVSIEDKRTCTTTHYEGQNQYNIAETLAILDHQYNLGIV